MRFSRRKSNLSRFTGRRLDQGVNILQKILKTNRHFTAQIGILLLKMPIFYPYFIPLFSARVHTWSQIDLYHVLYLPESKDWPLHSPNSVSVSAKIQYHAWISFSGTILAPKQIFLRKKS